MRQEHELAIALLGATGLRYQKVAEKLARGEILILDGGTGTELERRGVVMDPKAWCGPATIGNVDILQSIHRDYIAAGADIITANTYGCSPMMLAHAGVGDQFESITRTAIEAAQKARRDSGRDDVPIAGSLSHMVPRPPGEILSDLSPTPERSVLDDSFGRLAELLRDAGCDIVLAEMLYHPDRMRPALEAAANCGLPMWAGLAAKHGKDGEVLSFAKHTDIPFAEIVAMLADFDIAAAGIMHTPSNSVSDAIEIVRMVYDGPLLCRFLGCADERALTRGGLFASEKRQGTKSRDVGLKLCRGRYGDLSARGRGCCTHRGCLAEH